MSERLDSVAYDRDPRNFMTGADLPLPQQEPDYSPETAATIDNEVRDIVHAGMDRALTILREKRDILERRLLATDAKRLARDHGLIEKAIRSAREDLGVKIHRDGFGPGSKSWWSLPKNA
jgi:cell division protease FtsH